MENEEREDKEKAVQAQMAGENSIPQSSIFVPMAESLRLQGQYEEAIETLKGGLEKRPDSLPARLLLGRCYLEKGMFSEAKAELEIVARGVEDCLPVYRMLGHVYLQEKDVDKALEVLRKILYFQTAGEAVSKEVSPLEMGMLLRGSPFVTLPSSPAAPPPVSPAPPEEPAREKSEAAEEELGAKAVIQTDTMADIYIRQGHLERALSIYQEILTKEPGNATVREKYDFLKRRMEKDRQAEALKKVQGKLERWLAVVSTREGPTHS